MSQVFVAWLFLAGTVLAAAAPSNRYAEEISNLINPKKLAKLEARGANPRVQKYVAHLAEAKAAGLAPAKVAAESVALAGMKGEAAKLTAEAMVRNLTIAERLGCLDKAGLAEMRQGNAATIRRGPYARDQLSVDHIIPRAVAPKLDRVIANLELMPLRMNEGKNDRVGTRQVDLARKLRKAGLLNAKGLRAVERAAR
jgi:hypothetical protein